MTQATDDSRLIARIAGKDEAALRALLARHQVRLFRFVQRLVRNEAIAEELTNEVFLEVWRNAGKYEGRASVTTWLFSIAHHRAVSVLRKRGEETWDPDEAERLEDAGDGPEVAAQKSDKSAILRRCMAELSAEHREIIDLVYYHEMSIAEAAEVLAIPANTVKTRMFYARKRLSELLAARNVDRGWP